MSLTTFADLKGNATKLADGSKSLGQSFSPFQDGKTFRVSGYGYKVLETDGKASENAKPLPVLKTTLGDLFISMAIRSKVSADGEILTPDGTFNDFIRDTILANPDKTNKELLSLIVEGCKDKEVTIRRTPYPSMTKDNVRYVSFMVNLDF